MSSKKQASNTQDDSANGSDESENAGPRKVKPYCLSEVERGGKVSRVMTDDVRVWKTVE